MEKGREFRRVHIVRSRFEKLRRSDSHISNVLRQGFVLRESPQEALVSKVRRLDGPQCLGRLSRIAERAGESSEVELLTREVQAELKFSGIEAAGMEVAREAHRGDRQCDIETRACLERRGARRDEMPVPSARAVIGGVESVPPGAGEEGGDLIRLAARAAPRRPCQFPVPPFVKRP